MTDFYFDSDSNSGHLNVPFPSLKLLLKSRVESEAVKSHDSGDTSIFKPLLFAHVDTYQSPLVVKTVPQSKNTKPDFSRLILKNQ